MSNLQLESPSFPPDFLTSRRIGALAVSAAAAATALWVRQRARRAEQDNPPVGKFIYIDGVRLHFVMRGEGPPVVLLHGATVTHADFLASGLLDQLARDHQVIAFDRPGFGHSARPRNRLWTPSAQAGLMHRALTGLGIQRPVVVGHSMGSLVALAMALDWPASVSGLVLAGGYFYPTVRIDALWTAPVALPVLGDLMRYTVTALSARALLDRMIERMFAPLQAPPEFHAALAREMMLRPLQLRANAEDAAFMMPQARSLSRRYHELRLPVALIAGENDKIVDPQAHSCRLHTELAHSRLLVVPGAGHMVHYTQQRRLAAVIRECGQGVAAGSTAALTDPRGSPAKGAPELQHRDEHAIT